MLYYKVNDQELKHAVLQYHVTVDGPISVLLCVLENIMMEKGFVTNVFYVNHYMVLNSIVS